MTPEEITVATLSVPSTLGDLRQNMQVWWESGRGTQHGHREEGEMPALLPKEIIPICSMEPSELAAAATEF